VVLSTAAGLAAIFVIIAVVAAAAGPGDMTVVTVVSALVSSVIAIVGLGGAIFLAVFVPVVAGRSRNDSSGNEGKDGSSLRQLHDEGIEVKSEVK
jgi:hypothetical protein